MFDIGIVVYAPGNGENELLDGAVLKGPGAVQVAIDAGYVVLPHFSTSERRRMGGYCRVGWGEGWEVEPGRGGRVCPMLLEVDPTMPFLYWAAVLEVLRPGTNATFRLVAHPEGSSTSVNLAATEDEAWSLEGGSYGKTYVARGRRRVSADRPGLLAVDLYVQSNGVNVLVSAVSQSRIDAPLR